MAKKLKEEGIEALKDFKIQIGYPIRMALAERVSSTPVAPFKLYPVEVP